MFFWYKKTQKILHKKISNDSPLHTEPEKLSEEEENLKKKKIFQGEILFVTVLQSTNTIVYIVEIK